jgi:hypothetical protein
MEAKYYYAGLPSAPVLVARTGTIPWEAPTGQEEYGVLKELRPVGNHPLREVWEDNLALKLHALLDSMKVDWTSTEVVRIGKLGEVFAPGSAWYPHLSLAMTASSSPPSAGSFLKNTTSPTSTSRSASQSLLAGGAGIH